MKGYSDWPEELHNRAKQEFHALLEQMQILISALKIEDQVQVSTDILGKAVIDYLEDIQRLENFEDIVSNIAKIYAYSTYWILRRSPIIITDPKNASEDLRHINERLCHNAWLIFEFHHPI